MLDDYIYTVTQAALILNKSDKTIRSYATDGFLQTTKKIEGGSGIEKVFISARSLAELAERRKIALNFEALEKYTVDRDLLSSVFQGERPREERREESAPLPPDSLPQSRANPAEENAVIALLREQVGKLEIEKDELKRDVKEKERQLEDKNLALISVTKEMSERYQLIAMAREQAEARLAKLTEHTRILHLSTNRDIRRLQEGKLQAGDLSFLPLPSDISSGDYETSRPEPDEFTTPVVTPEDAAVSITVDPTPPPPPIATAPVPDETRQTEEPSSTPPEQAPAKRAERKQKRARVSAERTPAKEAPQKKRGFFRRIFGG